MMAQPTNQFTPAQILEAGRRAEAEGRPDYAQQFYRHLADYHAHSPEADEARLALAHLEAPGSHFGADTGPGFLRPAGSSPGRTGARGADTEASGPRGRDRSLSLAPILGPAIGAAAASIVFPETRDRYRLSRTLAYLQGLAGWAALLSGIARLAAPLAPPEASTVILETTSSLPAPAAMIVGGAAIVLLSRLLRAQFDASNAAQDLVAIERAKAGEIPDPN